ncbi:MAG: sugar ABC transporter substrate-binding protein, partial [Propionibacteriaceae bacterium]
MRKKLLSIGALVLSASIAMTGCSSSESSKSTDSNAKGSGTLTVWVDQNREASIKAIADQFQKDTGVTLNVVVKQFDDMKKDAVAQIPTGKGPDVFIGANDWTGSLAKNGTIQPVELGSKKADFLPVAVSAFTYEGKTYGVPIQIENLALVRNTQLAPNAPSSWDDLVKTGNELVAAGKASMPIAI